MKKIIDTNGANGLIFCYPSGVQYTNQTGGCACNHPKVEGVFVPWPFPNRLIDEGIGELLYDQYGEITERQANLIDGILPDVIRVDRNRLDDSEEAWLWVVVSGDEYSPYPDYSGFDYPVKAVIVWENSD